MAKDKPQDPPVEPPVDPPKDPPKDPPVEPPEPPPPEPHPMEERLSQAEAEIARLNADNQALKATVRKTPWLRRLLDTPLWDENPRQPPTQ